MVEQYKRHPNTNCFVCRKAIYRRPGEIKENGGKVFCSSACYGQDSRKETPCIVCGKPILAGLNKKTCSRACSNINRAGTKYTGRAPKDKVKNAQALKRRLMSERGTKCERCGYEKTEILQVHHIDRDRNNNTLRNLELICPNCHYEEHHLNGMKR